MGRLTFALLLAVALSTSAAAARAQEGDEAVAIASRPQWAIGFNPLAIAIGRYSFDVQHLLAPHHALVVNVHGDYASRDWQAMQYDRRDPFWGFGGEVGWRWFPTRAWMRGFFLGASLLGGYYNYGYYGARLPLPGFGIAGDMGGMAELGGGMFLVLGAGLQNLWTHSYPKDIAPGLSQVVGEGIDPRVLVTIGALLK
jgi:hypothetical protein